MPYTPTWNNPYLGQSSYQPYQQIGMQSPLASPTQYQQPVNGTIQVNGRDSAMQYNLPPNSTSPALFDKNGKMFYVVTTDGTGAKTVEAFDFEPHKEEQVRIDGAQFVSKAEYDQFVARVSAALEALNGIHEPVRTATATRLEGTNVNAQTDDAGRPIATDYKPMPE